MGVVVAATHLHLDQSVALKFLRTDVSAELDALARFTREARAAAQLRSEYVAHVLDAGVTEDGTPYMAMEYLEGQSLAMALQQYGRLDVPSAVGYVIEACEGLAEAHARGIVHRDIKPDNLFLVERAPGWNAIKILDFGISKLAFSDGGNIATGIILGSPCYMSPEQLRSTATVDHRTDLWSLGATLYELLVGHAAFDASQTLPELVTAILDRPSPRARAAMPELPAELDAVIERCLTKDREARFKSAGELAVALLPFASSRLRFPAERAVSMPPAFDTDPAAVSSGRPSSPSDPPPSDPEASTGVLPGPTTPRSGSLALTVRADEVNGSKAQAPKSPLSSRRWVSIAGGAGVVTLGFVIALSIKDGTGGKPAPGAPLAAPSSSAAPSAAAFAAGGKASSTATTGAGVVLAPVRAESERAELVVRVSPSFARITIDDKPVDNPALASFPKDGSTHRIVAKAWGYDTKSTSVTVTADTIVDLGLDRHVSASPAAAAPVRTAKRAPAAEATALPIGPALKPVPLVASGLELDSAGGRAPLHPIETKDPYGAP